MVGHWLIVIGLVAQGILKVSMMFLRGHSLMNLVMRLGFGTRTTVWMRLLSVAPDMRGLMDTDTEEMIIQML